MSAYLTVQHENRKHWISDLTDQTFGHLTALRPTGKRKGGVVVWKCRCDCEDGNIVYRSTYQLRRTRKHNLHCGCRDTESEKLTAGRISNITNKTFGHLTALRPTDKRSCGAVIWECECRCGKTIYRTVDWLKTGGKNQSCGCMLPEIARANNAKCFHYIDGTRIESIRNQSLLSNNKSGIRGVHYDANAKKWRAVIYFQGKQIHLGLYDDIEDAEMARKTAEDIYYRPVIEEFEARVKAV